MIKKITSITLIFLFCSCLTAFANDISQEVSDEKQVEQQVVPDFKATSGDSLSIEENIFIAKYRTNPKDANAVYARWKRFINSGIILASVGGGLYTVGTPIAVIFSILSYSPRTFIDWSTALLIQTLGFVGIIAGVIIQALCCIPFIKSYVMSKNYEKLYGKKIKEINVINEIDSENKKVTMAMAFGIG